MRTIAAGPVSDQHVLFTPNERLMKNVTGPPHLFSPGMLQAWTEWHYLQHQKDLTV